MFKDVIKQVPEKGDTIVIACFSWLKGCSLKVSTVRGVRYKNGKGHVRLATGEKLTDVVGFRRYCLLLKDD